MTPHQGMTALYSPWPMPARILLGNSANGKIAVRGNVLVVKQNGQVTYNPGEHAGTVLYNTMTTPRGSTGW